MLRLKGKRWGELSKEVQEMLLKNVNVDKVDDDGYSVIDITNDFSILGKVVIKENKKVIKIDDEDVIYSPIGRCNIEDVYDYLKELENKVFGDIEELTNEVIGCYRDYNYEGDDYVITHDLEVGDERYILNYVDNENAPQFAVYFSELGNGYGYSVHEVKFIG